MIFMHFSTYFKFLNEPDPDKRLADWNKSKAFHEPIAILPDATHKDNKSKDMTTGLKAATKGLNKYGFR